MNIWSIYEPIYVPKFGPNMLKYGSYVARCPMYRPIYGPVWLTYRSHIAHTRAIAMYDHTWPVYLHT